MGNALRRRTFGRMQAGDGVTVHEPLGTTLLLRLPADKLSPREGRRDRRLDVGTRPWNRGLAFDHSGRLGSARTSG